MHWIVALALAITSDCSEGATESSRFMERAMGIEPTSELGKLRVNVQDRYRRTPEPTSSNRQGLKH
jgi:hypothetical protein